VAFDHHPAVAAVNPPMSYPIAVARGRFFPTTGVPSVGVTVPAMIAGNPHMMRTRPWSTFFNNDVRRCNSNNNFRENGAERQRSSDDQTCETFLEAHKPVSFRSGAVLRSTSESCFTALDG
jgi:hypothetical protein